ncbi:Protein kinase domain [Arabidopsis suecica]|uniref:cyclin-dependent kinase n=1 Tax=Arabidopsis suecica TaxID=45249 RepID=A0A8T2BBW3_ARASU|nr:Protein kinase domain [Arabidopsis suecica]
MDKYEKMEKVGEGTYMKVYKAKEIKTGKLVALKKTKLDMVYEGIPSNTLREISLLQMLSKSDYVVCLLAVEPFVPSPESHKSNLYLVFEYLDNDLRKFINSHREANVSAL